MQSGLPPSPACYFLLPHGQITTVNANFQYSYGNKPDGWKASGKRVKRGLYRTKTGLIVNADLNGSANILVKVASNLSIDLGLLGRRTLTSAARIKLWNVSTKKPLLEQALSAESSSMQERG